MYLKLPRNYSAMSTVDLLRLKIAMQNRITDIVGQIDRCNLLPVRPAHGFGSRSWLMKAKLALAKYKRDVERINCAVLDHKDKPDHIPDMVALSFVEASRRRLTDVVFNAIMQEAKEEQL
ncbi:MAG: hypothetical protein ABFD76_05060 [Smithella sp.]